MRYVRTCSESDPATGRRAVWRARKRLERTWRERQLSRGRLDPALPQLWRGTYAGYYFLFIIRVCSRGEGRDAVRTVPTRYDVYQWAMIEDGVGLERRNSPQLTAVSVLRIGTDDPSSCRRGGKKNNSQNASIILTLVLGTS
jgi:hypothetical protein